ncbi:transporter associated domain-containing protein [Pelagibacterium montanilacus]|uniref:transporter associated domain-containing protein n=1 Tax=Pelagibacterium montanilacus TaxID=2185280 RepID=UPI001FE48631|nr:hemolysin family protein [Pelagibacterium montanilacus]
MSSKSPSLRSDIQEALDAPEDDLDGDSFSASERAILQNVLKLGGMRVEDVMVPRADIEAVDAAVAVGHVISRFRDGGHSRMPVFEDTLDNVIGMIHIKDVLDKVTEEVKPEKGTSAGPANGNGNASNGAGNGNGNGNSNGSSPVRFLSASLKQKISKLGLVRKVLFVPPAMPVTELLASMQTTRMHMAVVVDEYGGTDGLVTIEDLLEAVVGDIEDEHDEDEAVMVRAVGEDTYLADARVELGEVIDVVGSDFDPGELAEDVDTLGGLVFALAGRVPVRGEVLSRLKGFEIEITRADPRRVRQVRIVRRRRKLRGPLAAGAKPVREAPANAETEAPAPTPEDEQVNSQAAE